MGFITGTNVMNHKLMIEALAILAQAPELINQFGLMPNFKFPTLGGELLWNDMAECDGWRVQRNSFTGHCRILDRNDVRQAWGAEANIMEFFEKLLKQ